MYKLEVLGALKWYFESKKLSLRNALKFRAPLSVEDQVDLRLYYSQYFVSLLSATEFLFDKKYLFSKEFENLLYEKFVFEGANKGEENYLYLKELRNAIVHRGYDILNASNFVNDFPLIIAPSKTQSQNGKKEYSAFSTYLIDIINVCENYIGNIIVQHLESFLEKLPSLTNDGRVQQSKDHIESCVHMPDWVKLEALKFIDSEDYLKINIDQTQEILDFLRKNALSDLTRVLDTSK